jgi:primosomal protein N' (replication factor Y)
LPADFLAMVEFAAAYYHFPLGQTLFTALPTGLRDARDIVAVDERPFGLTALVRPSRRQPGSAPGWPCGRHWAMGR